MRYESKRGRVACKAPHLKFRHSSSHLTRAMRSGWTALKKLLPQQPSQRLLSSKALGKLPAIQNLHPPVRDFADELSQSQPYFSLRPRDVRILSQPNEFLNELLVRNSSLRCPNYVTYFDPQGMINRARKRIFLSSLYIGSSEDYLVCFLTHLRFLN